MFIYITAISPFEGSLYQLEEKEQLDFIDILLGYYSDCDIRTSETINTNKVEIKIYFDNKSIDEDPIFVNERTDILLTFDNQYNHENHYSFRDQHINIDTFELFGLENNFMKKVSFVNKLLQKIMNDKTIFII